MSFLYPLFLLAGLSVAIPVLIHLFNLRRYKTVLFPHTRFLKNIQLNSRRQSQVRYKWLLALRILFILSLVLAFAQPFFSSQKKGKSGNNLGIIYVDNSYSMSVKKGARSLLDIAKEAARNQLLHASPGQRFLLLTNDKPAAWQPMTADKALAALSDIDISGAEKNNHQVLTNAQSLMQNEAADAADLYYYSDFQRSSFSLQQDTSLLRHMHFYGIPVQQESARNIFIDTAYLLSPVLQTGMNNQLVTVTKYAGKNAPESPVLQLAINGQVKSASSLSFNDKAESVDTFSFQVNNTGWQQLTLTVNDAAIRFDDTFRISARSAPALSVLVLNEGQTNPYIQAAFRAYSGFRLTQADAAAAPQNFREYNLVILNGITHLDAGLGKSLSEALQQGQSICIFPGRTNNLNALNEGLHLLGDISVTSVDTAIQATSSLQQGSDLVKDLFERIPENVQLPQANWHYIIHAGLTANEQSVISFRNGDPFLAKYTPSKGSLYLCATSADLPSGNFPGSYFFVPFLYQIAVQSGGGDVYAITIGRQQAAYLPLNNADERNMVHLHSNGSDIIPPQRASGAGVAVIADQAVSQAGFYNLTAAGTDTTTIALNASRTESVPDIWTPAQLQESWKGTNIKWVNNSDGSNFQQDNGFGSFPLWKVCVILALFMLAAETYVLAGGFRKSTIAA
ncbi:vWA domain-containing protein [Chitinophagaceae bacterium MMS25-I14]